MRGSIFIRAAFYRLTPGLGGTPWLHQLPIHVINTPMSGSLNSTWQVYPANTGRWASVVLILGRHRRRWNNFKWTLRSMHLVSWVMHAETVLLYCRASVADGVPTLKQHSFNVSWLLQRVYTRSPQQTRDIEPMMSYCFIGNIRLASRDFW